MVLRREGLVVAVAVLAIVLLWIPADAWAGPPPPTATDADSLLRLFRQMRTSVAAWQRGGQDAARVAFAALAALNVAWLGVELFSSQGGDIRSGLGKLGRELVVMSVFYSLIETGPQLARQIVDFLRSAADGVGGAPGEDQTWNALQEVVKASIGLLSNGEVGYLEVLWLGLCVVVVIALVGLTGAIMLVTEGATELILGLGAIVLAGGGAIWTRFLVQNYLRFSFSAGLALYVMRFVQSFVIGNLSVWAKEASGASGSIGDLVGGVVRSAATPVVGGPETIFTLLLTVIIQLVLVMAMPTVAVMLASGGVARVSEWAGIGAAQRLGGMGAQGLRHMAAAMSGGGAARVASAAAAAAGQGLSVLGSAGGAIPPAAGAGGAGAAREQGSGASARGVDAALDLGASLQEGASAAAGAAADGPAPVAGGGSSAPAEPGASGASGAGAEGNSSSAPRGRERGTANDGATGRPGSRSAWNGQSAPAPESRSKQRVATAEGARSAGGSGPSDSEPGPNNLPARRAGSVVGGGVAHGGATSGTVGAGGSGRGAAATRSSGAGAPGAGAGALSGAAGRGASQGGSAGARSAGAGTTQAAGASRDVMGAGAPTSSAAAPAVGPDAAPRGGASPGGGHVSPGRASAPSAAARGAVAAPGAAAAASAGRNGDAQRIRQEARRVAPAGPSARGEAGKRGEHG